MCPPPNIASLSAPSPPSPLQSQSGSAVSVLICRYTDKQERNIMNKKDLQTKLYMQNTILEQKLVVLGKGKNRLHLDLGIIGSIWAKLGDVALADISRETYLIPCMILYGIQNKSSSPFLSLGMFLACS